MVRWLAIHPSSASNPAGSKPHLLQELEMLRDRGEGNTERPGQG